MQQNIRAAMYYMQREIRMAGSDPRNTGNFGINTAENDRVIFLTDITPNGVLDGGETITYNFVDSDLDGIKDELQRNGQPVAQNIDALDFVYLDDSSPTNVLNTGGTGGDVPASDLDSIRSVEITIVARTDDPLLYGTANNRTYQNQQTDTIYTAPSDNFSRRRLTTVIHCRNLAL
jgi:type IV pilus assembly protein PilW